MKFPSLLRLGAHLCRPFLAWTRPAVQRQLIFLGPEAPFKDQRPKRWEGWPFRGRAPFPRSMDTISISSEQLPPSCIIFEYVIAETKVRLNVLTACMYLTIHVYFSADCSPGCWNVAFEGIESEQSRGMSCHVPCPFYACVEVGAPLDVALSWCDLK